MRFGEADLKMNNQEPKSNSLISHSASRIFINHQDQEMMWRELHQKPELREGLRREIRDSWERSYSYGVDPERTSAIHLTQHEFVKARQESEYLMETASSVMGGLMEFIAGTGFVLVLTDANLCVLSVMGDRQSLNEARGGGLVEGTIWPEELVGTNASALAVALARPISVVGYEHFCRIAIPAANCAAPIIDGGKIIGVLGMEAPYCRFNTHTLGMVMASVKHIESKMVLERATKYNEHLIESMSEAVMVVDDRNALSYINENCCRLFRRKRAEVIGQNIYDVLGHHPDNHYFVSLATGRIATNETVMLNVGQERIKCHVTCNPLNYSEPPCIGTLLIIRESKHVDHMVRSWIGSNAKVTFADLAGENQSFLEVKKLAMAASSSNSNVLLLGESGTGKDMIAQAMHNAGPRKNNPFVAINCAALPKELIGSELFGYEEGAFTGARKGGNIGKFELADQGTIFLDEIGDMPLDLQASLLRVLEEKSIMRLGGNKLIPVNVRIIAATNKDLESEISLRRFRRDLYYRLGVIRITIPPLRDRPDDVIMLARYLTHKICQRLNKPPYIVAPDVIEAFLRYPWPGNVREMQNVLEGAIQLSTQPVITYEMIKRYLSLPPKSLVEAETELDNTEAEVSISSLERIMVKKYLHKFNNNKSKTAKALGISRKTLYRWIKEYGISD
jgi:transcriptional regulator with PAS, ATPase and Fis domain